MRRPSRNVEIFSMSALDLFASGFGAFIVIAVILMPYFPNEGDSPVKVAEVQAKLDGALEHIAELEERLSDPKLPPLDLVIALDVTGSMESQISGLKEEIVGLVRVLTKLSASVGVGIVTFSDRCVSPTLTSYKLSQVMPTGPTLSSLQRHVNGISVNMGANGRCNSDGPEAVDQALAMSIAMPWRAEAERRVIVVITDNPAYPEKQMETLSVTQSFVGSPGGGRVSAVNANTQGAQDAEAYLRQLAQVGQGEYVQAGGSMTATLLIALLD